MKKIRWGVIGTGWIANMFANTMRGVEMSEIYAVCNVSQESADEYKKKFGVERAYGNAEELLSLPEIDAVYIATPHCFHKQYIAMSLEYGKHVLCVKPITLNAQQLKEVINIAKAKKLLLMEAMWTRFKPEFVNAKKQIKDGAIGKVELIQAECLFHPEYNPQSRLFNKNLGGGALLDVGIYITSLAFYFMDKDPATIKAVADIGPTGVDHMTSILFGYDDGAVASLTTSMVSGADRNIVIRGTKGMITIRDYWYSDSYELEIYGQKKQVFSFPISKSDQIEKHDFMIEAFNQCLREGKTDNDIIPISETLRIVKVMDIVLEQIGVQYPIN